MAKSKKKKLVEIPKVEIPKTSNPLQPCGTGQHNFVASAYEYISVGGQPVILRVPFMTCTNCGVGLTVQGKGSFLG